MKKISLVILFAALVIASASYSCKRDASNVEKPLLIALSKGSPSDSYKTYTRWLDKTEEKITYINLYSLGIDSALSVLETVSGILFTGGEDIHPARYGLKDDSLLCDEPDLYRDSLEFTLLDKAMRLNIPILGVCRGLQLINTVNGGTLYFDIPTQINDTIKHRLPDTYDCYHSISVTEGSYLHGITGITRGNVNSNHHQGIMHLSGNLSANAFTPDGLIEAVVPDDPEGRSFFLGIQWHPERMDFSNPFSGKIAEAFINASKKMKMETDKFGSINGQDVLLFTVKNSNGLVMKVMNYGGIIVNLMVPDKTGKTDDIVLGFDSFEGYRTNGPYFGAIVGRYANRIAHGRFELDGQIYSLARNNGINALHGGIKGFDKVVWEAQPFYAKDGDGLRLNYLSKDMEEGYPGNLNIEVLYQLKHNNELYIRYIATTDKAAPVNLTHHSYFNLGGTTEKDILDHVLMINAERFTPVDSTLIPTGKLRSVDGPMDFRQPVMVGSRIEQVAGGYDHNYVLNDPSLTSPVASLYDPATGRFMEVFTTEPGMQFYSGNFLDGSIVGKKGIVYKKHHGLCLETQHFPDSPNHPDFPNTVLHPGETFRSETVYRFSTR